MKFEHVNDIKKLKDGEQLTLYHNRKVNYKTGYQVEFEGIDSTNIAEVCLMIRFYEGSATVLFKDGIYHVGRSYRIEARRAALELCILLKKDNIYDWKHNSIIDLTRYYKQFPK